MEVAFKVPVLPTTSKVDNNQVNVIQLMKPSFSYQDFCEYFKFQWSLSMILKMIFSGK